MSFAEAVKSVFRQYAGFEGRARRSEYWWFYLFTLLATAVPYAVAVVVLFASGVGLSGETQDADPGASLVVVVLFGLVVLIGLVLLIPQISVSVRRLHDTGRSGWWYLISLIPFGGLVLLVFFVMDSEPQANIHGPNPKNPVGAGEWGQLASG